MATTCSPKQLALQLAGIAQKIRDTYGDLRAQTIPYALLLKCWDNSANVDSLLRDVNDPKILLHIEETLKAFDLDAIRYRYETDGKDAAVYFYEEFLRAYDSASSRGRGVLYTPPEVVDFIVRGIESLLQDRFGKSLDEALIVDPCCGVGTFLRHIERNTTHSPQMLGMELMPAQCAIARCLISKAEVKEANFLSGTLFDTENRLPVIIGNPPYSGHSANAGKIADLMADYRTNLTERNPKWLQDDYVKFIRMAQHQIDAAGQGIIAFITNHSFIFNPTFRAMRTSLMQTFDEIFVLDLRGNMKRLDKLDDNIFPIQMGVAITFFVKTSHSPMGFRASHSTKIPKQRSLFEETSNSTTCAVRYASIEGSHKHKLSALSSLTLDTIDWADVPLAHPFNLFIPRNDRLSEEFYGFTSLFDIFQESTIGFVTSRDSFAIGFTREKVLLRISALRNGNVSDIELRKQYGVGDLDIASARRALLDDPDWESKAVEVLYRPFDRRWVYYSRAIMERPRLPFMENLMRDNISLAIGRAGQVTGSNQWDVVFCTDRPADLNLFRRGGAKLFPKYVYKGNERFSNMHVAGIDSDTLFNYIYAILHSTIYRRRYAEFLSIDYPRIPIPAPDQMVNLAALGSELIEAHLLRISPPTHVSSSEQNIRIGGYELPSRYIRERSQVDSKEQIALVLSAIESTRNLQARINAIITEYPPW